MQQDANAPTALSITRETTRHTPESSLLSNDDDLEV